MGINWIDLDGSISGSCPNVVNEGLLVLGRYPHKASEQSTIKLELVESHVV